jgi:hypothetical protein
VVTAPDSLPRTSRALLLRNVGIALVAIGIVSTSSCTSEPPNGAPTASAEVSLEPLPEQPTATPAPSSGPLDEAVLPQPTSLGPGWSYRVEGADLEEGAGNDTPFQERDPEEIVLYTIPMGCEVRSDTPVPRHVLQATYGHEASGSFAVALRLRFSNEEEAGKFAEDRAADLLACRDQPDDPFSGAPAPVIRVSGDAERSLVEYRLTGDPTTWYGATLVAGSDVLTLDTDADPDVLVDWDGLGYQSP